MSQSCETLCSDTKPASPYRRMRTEYAPNAEAARDLRYSLVRKPIRDRATVDESSPRRRWCPPCECNPDPAVGAGSRIREGRPRGTPPADCACRTEIGRAHV